MEEIKLEAIYKNVKVPMKHCKRCKEILEGNGSTTTPYKCKCGVWNYNFLTNEYWTLVNI